MSQPHPVVRVVLVAGLDEQLIASCAKVVDQRRDGWSLTYRVLVDGDHPLLVRTRLRNGVCLDQEPLATSHGCIACAVRDDVLEHLERWAQDPQPPPVTVVLPAGAEPSCLVDPVDLTFLAQMARSGGHEHEDLEPRPVPVQVTAVVVALDGSTLLEQVSGDDDLVDTGIPHGAFGHRPLAELVLAMVRSADVVSLDGLGPSHEVETRRAFEVVAHLAPGATVVRSALHARLNDCLATASHDPTRTELMHESLSTPPAGRPPAWGISTQVWRTARPLHPGRLMSALDRLAEAAVALEGPVWMATRPHEVLRLSIAGGAVSLTGADAWLAEAPEEVWAEVSPWRRTRSSLDWDPCVGDRGARLVALTTEDGEAERVRGILDSVVLDDAEFSAGPDLWRNLDDPFIPWLGDPWPTHPSHPVPSVPCDGVHGDRHDPQARDLGARPDRTAPQRSEGGLG